MSEAFLISQQRQHPKITAISWNRQLVSRYAWVVSYLLAAGLSTSNPMNPRMTPPMTVPYFMKKSQKATGQPGCWKDNNWTIICVVKSELMFRISLCGFFGKLVCNTLLALLINVQYILMYRLYLFVNKLCHNTYIMNTRTCPFLHWILRRWQRND